MSSDEEEEVSDDGDSYGASAKRGRYQTRDEQLYGVFLDDGENGDFPPNKRGRSSGAGGASGDSIKRGISFVKKTHVVPDAAPPDLATQQGSKAPAQAPEDASAPVVPPRTDLSNEHFRKLMAESGSKNLANSDTPSIGLGSTAHSTAPASATAAPTPAIEKPSWEKHTKGFGMKMLMKMGFKGGGLGKEGKGITRHVEVAVRAGKAAGLGSVKESTALQANKRIQRELQGKTADPESDEEASVDRSRRRQRLKSTAEQTADQGLWRRGAQREVAKPSKRRYVTPGEDSASSGASAPGADDDDGESAKATDVILDMRGPQTRVLSSLQDIPEDDGGGMHEGAPPPRLLGQELLHNLNVHVDLTEGKLHDFDKRRKAEREQQGSLRIDIDALAERVAAGREQLGRFSEIQAVIADAAKASSGAVPRLEIFRTLRSPKFAREFSMFGMARVAPALVKPALEEQMREWSPLADPGRLVDLLAEWEALLIDPAVRRDVTIILHGQTTGAYVNMVDDLIIRKIRSCLLSEWDAVNAEPCVRLVEGLSSFRKSSDALVSQEALKELLLIVIYPKLKRAIDDWDPRVASVAERRIDLWVHPWLPHLSEELASSYPTIRRKLVSALGPCNCTDPVISTRNQEMVRPWIQVFDSKSSESMAIQIGGKLAVQLRSVEVNPANQCFEVLNSVLEWSSILSQVHMSCLLRGEFFPRWKAALRDWLCSSDSTRNKEIADWYRSWKSYLSSKITLDGYVRAEFGHALDLMLSSRKMSPQQFKSWDNSAEGNPCSYVALVRAIRMKSAELAAASRQQERAAKVARARAAPASFKTVVADFAEDKGVEFVPRHGRSFSGLQIFSFGGISCYLEDDLVHVESGAREQWMPVSLEELHEMSIKTKTKGASR